MNENDKPPFPPSGEPGNRDEHAASASQPAAQPPQQPYRQQQAFPPPAQPYGQQPYGQPTYQQPPYQQPPYQQQAYQQQPYQQQPYYGQTGYYNPPGAFYVYDSGPDNGLAVASLTLGIIAIALMFFTAGFSAPLSIICSIVGVILGHKGKKAVDEGRTRKHRDVAVAGFWTSIAGAIIAVLAIVFWVLFIAYADTASSADPGDAASIARGIIDALTGMTQPPR
ncbi:MAG: DUF4190 domain-containing protein [Actinobacteria bacterium]|nr:DUF4190 domain-containing protein [Actinomycetota bacterium]